MQQAISKGVEVLKPLVTTLRCGSTGPGRSVPDPTAEEARVEHVWQSRRQRPLSRRQAGGFLPSHLGCCNLVTGRVAPGPSAGGSDSTGGFAVEICRTRRWSDGHLMTALRSQPLRGCWTECLARLSRLRSLMPEGLYRAYPHRREVPSLPNCSTWVPEQ